MFAHLKPFPTHGVTSRIKGFNTPSSLITELEKDNNIDPMCRGWGQSYAHQTWRACELAKCGGAFVSHPVSQRATRYEIPVQYSRDIRISYHVNLNS